MVIWRKKRKLKHEPNRTVALSEFEMLLLEKNEKYAFRVPLTPATVQTMPSMACSHIKGVIYPE